jgi:hypothetical protein
MGHDLLILILMLLTALLSAAGAGVSTFYLNASKDAMTFWGKKAEELYTEAELVDRTLSRYFEEGYSFVQKPTQGSSFDEKALENAGGHFASIKMLVGFYYPALTSPLTRAISATATAHRMLRGACSAQQQDRDALLESLDSAVCEVKDALEALKDGILKEGRILSSGKFSALLWRPLKPTSAGGRILNVPA